MEYRLQTSKLPLKPPYLPALFLRVLDRDDPGMILRKTGKIPDTLKGKEILVLSGKEDQLVPWSASNTFIQHLEKDCPGLHVQVYGGMGHEYPPYVQHDLCKWL